MRVGDSFGEACRNCGSTQIIISPPSSSGRCAVCSPEAVAWAVRLAQTARRQQAVEQQAMLAAADEARAAQRAQRWSERRAAIARTGTQLRGAASNLVREVQLRVVRTSQA